MYADPSVIRKYANVTVPPKLFSVAVDLQTTVPTTGRARLVVPYLEMDGTVAATSAAFPQCYRIPLELPLAVPSAAWFTVAAMFTTADGLSQKAPLEPFHVAFPDLLVPAAPAEVRTRRWRIHVLRMHADQLWRTAPFSHCRDSRSWPMHAGGALWPCGTYLGRAATPRTTASQS